MSHLPFAAADLPFAVSCATIGYDAISMHMTSVAATLSALELSRDEMFPRAIFEVDGPDGLVAMAVDGRLFLPAHAGAELSLTSEKEDGRPGEGVRSDA